MAVAVEPDHLGDLLVQGAAGEGDPERVRLDGPLLVVQSRGAGVLGPLVAGDAVVGLAQVLAWRKPGIGQVEAVPVAARLGGPWKYSGRSGRG